MGSSKKGKAKDLDKVKEDSKKLEKKEDKPKFVQKAGPKALVRVANTDLDGGKNLITAIKHIRGVSHFLANAIIKVTGFDPHKRLGEYGPTEIQKIEEVIKNPSAFGIPIFALNRRKDPATGKDSHISGSDILTAAKFDVQKQIDMKTYRGWRHMLGQPVRGQRTRSHFRLGRVVGVLRKEIKIQMTKAGVEAPAAGGAPAPAPAAKKEEKK